MLRRCSADLQRHHSSSLLLVDRRCASAHPICSSCSPPPSLPPCCSLVTACVVLGCAGQHLGSSMKSTFDYNVLNLTVVHSQPRCFWGWDHIPGVALAAHLTRTRALPCLVIEAGTHKGTVAIVAALLGCEVYALEGSPKNIGYTRTNVRLNPLSQPNMRIIGGWLSDKPGQRIDEKIATSGHPITLLKMDIDGPDLAAMRGAEGLFRGRGVDMVQIEFGPKKLSGPGAPAERGAQYLEFMHVRGFEAFLMACKWEPNATRLPVACPQPFDWSASDYWQKNEINVQGTYPGVPWQEEHLLACLWPTGKSRAGCRAMRERHRISRDKFVAFSGSIITEVELIFFRASGQHVGAGTATGHETGLGPSRFEGHR